MREHTKDIIETLATRISFARDVRPDIDEIAACFDTEGELDSFVREAVGLYGLENFNSVSADGMVRMDKPGEGFTVRFEFLRLPGMEWRIEAMCNLGGSAPLHEEAMRTHGSPCIIHLSYKLPTEQEYLEQSSYIRDFYGGRMVAQYRNTYGRFAYWDVGEQWYLKPRVNLRDDRVNPRVRW